MRTASGGVRACPRECGGYCPSPPEQARERDVGTDGEVGCEPFAANYSGLQYVVFPFFWQVVLEPSLLFVYELFPLCCVVLDVPSLLFV